MALSAGNQVLQAIKIPKALPDNEEEALNFLYLASDQLSSEEYLKNINSFISQYPSNSEALMLRASTHAKNGAFQLAENDIKQAFKIAPNKDEVHFSFSKLIAQQLLSTPNFSFSDWSLEKALTEANSAYNINPLPLYKLHQEDIL